MDPKDLDYDDLYRLGPILEKIMGRELDYDDLHRLSADDLRRMMESSPELEERMRRLPA